ncbi:MAG: toll/interleukin-1 receptor domain-containing protein [Dokdonella sp.]
MAIPSASSGRRYRAFISYSHQDQAWAAWLHKALEIYRVPSRLVGLTTPAGVIPPRLAPVFRDRDELPSATDLSRTVNEALAQSANLIVICSPHAAQSRWVMQEVLAFKRFGRADRVFCLIVDGEPNATDLIGREAEECFAEPLRYRVDASGNLTRERSEPIAADARPGKDGKSNAKLKLIAGLLDVGFDALKRRELQRRNRRMVAITAVAMLVMLVTSALAINAVIARKAAVVAREAAERRQKQAETLVGFMLGDLNDKLGEVRRLDIMQAVDDQAMRYFQGLPSSDVTDEALAQRATALHKIGSVRELQGRLPDALEAHRAAADIDAQLLQRAPGDVAREAAYADSLKWIGQVDFYQGDLDHALQNFERASELLQKALVAKPDDTAFASSLSAARTDAGRVLEARGDLAGAAAEYQAVLAIVEQLGAREPSEARWRSEQGFAWNNLGKIALQQGRLDQAVAAYRADQRIKAALAAGDPANHQWQEDLLVSNAILGRTLGLCGESATALRYVSDAVNSAKALMTFDPANTNFGYDFADYSQLLGRLLRQDGELDGAVAPVADAVRTLSKLLADAPTDSGLQQSLAQSHLENARLQRAMGHAEAAQGSGESALALAKDALATKADDRGWIVLTAQIETELGQIAAARDDTAAARAHWTRASETIAPIARSSQDPQVLAAWTSSLLLLGDIEAVQPLFARLSMSGYRAPDFIVLMASRKLDYPVNLPLAQRIAESMN